MRGLEISWKEAQRRRKLGFGQGEWVFGVLILMGRFNAREWRGPLGKSKFEHVNMWRGRNWGKGLELGLVIKGVVFCE